MKTIKTLNTIAIGLPLTLLLLSIIANEMLFFAAYSTMITGAIQVLLGLFLFIKEPTNRRVIAYLLVVATFFLLWYYNATIGYSDFLSTILFPIPLVLALYLSIIIYKKEKLWTSIFWVIRFT